MISDFLEAISGLTKANLLTGFWDNKRNEMRKKYEENLAENIFKMFGRGDSSFIQNFVSTEKNSRRYCEQRAVERKKIDAEFEKIINQKFK